MAVRVAEEVAEERADGTLLAVVPIPGTGTSLAIVGYQVPAGLVSPALVTPALVSPALVSPALVSTGAAAEPLDSGPQGTAPVADQLVADQLVTGRTRLVLDYDQRRVWVDEAEVPLTFQEFELLAFLVAHPTTVFTRADLVREVWQRDFAADSRTVDVHVSRLRHKLGPDHGKCLVTEYRVGYQFRPLPN